MTVLSWILMWFEALSGLRINYENSVILLVGRVHKACYSIYLLYIQSCNLLGNLSYKVAI